MATLAPTPAGGNSLADLIDGTASLAKTDCTGLDEGTIAASGFICEEGTRGIEADIAGGAQNDAGEENDAEAAGNNNDTSEEAEDATGDNNNNDVQNPAEDAAGDAAQQDEQSAEDAEAGNNSNASGKGAQQDEEDAQENAQSAGNAEQDGVGGSAGAGDDAATGGATGADATGGDGAGVNLFDLALQGFQPVDCTGIDEAVVAASGFNCIDGTRGA